jgi:ferrous iron transport protein B
LLVGNPNVGKTTLFNDLTGESGRVGNYPGVTVERRTAGLKRRLPNGAPEQLSRASLVDVPGAYSLSARSADEQIAINAALGIAGNPKPDLVCVVVDAGQLIRNLYLVLQLVELQAPVLVVLNMIDEVKERPPNPRAVEALFGVPCVATNARDGSGIEELRSTIFSTLSRKKRGGVEVRYGEALRAIADQVASALPPTLRRNVEHDRALARWALTSIEEDDELDGISPELRATVLDVQRTSPERDLDLEIIAARYAWLDQHAPSLYAAPQPKQRSLTSFTDRVDRVLLHPVFGFAIFLLVMFLIFQSLFSWADPAITLIEDTFSFLQRFFTEYLPEGLLRDALVQGVIGGVGNVLVFLPQILLLFFFVGLLEDSGYMARVAYLMDRVMRSVGLHGRAFVPMLSGFACAVPAIMATRTMERQRDRLLTMLVVPLMSCSARLPVYSLIIAALFPASHVLGILPVQGLLMVAMYLFSTLTALIAAAVLGRTAVKGRHVPLILELPRYRMPKLSGVLRMMWQRARSFLTEAGTVILAFTMILWVLLSFPKVDMASETPKSAAVTNSAPPPSEEEAAAQANREAEAAIAGSYGGRLGHALEPVLEPLGFDWKVGVGLIGAFAAREVFISTMGMVYGLGDVGDDDSSLRDKVRTEVRADGSPVYTPLMGLSLMIFFALACQCMSTVAVVKRETKTWRWPAFLFAYMTALAYATSFFVFQGGRLLGLG